jgi:hypothetical protein
MFLGLLNPDPISFVRGLDPYPRLWILQSVSKNSKKNLNFYFFLTFYLEKLCESSFKKYRNRQKSFLFFDKFFVGILKVNDENSSVVEPEPEPEP